MKFKNFLEGKEPFGEFPVSMVDDPMSILGAADMAREDPSRRNEFGKRILIDLIAFLKDYRNRENNFNQQDYPWVSITVSNLLEVIESLLKEWDKSDNVGRGTYFNYIKAGLSNLYKTILQINKHLKNQAKPTPQSRELLESGERFIKMIDYLLDNFGVFKLTQDEFSDISDEKVMRIVRSVRRRLSNYMVKAFDMSMWQDAGTVSRYIDYIINELDTLQVAANMEQVKDRINEINSLLSTIKEMDYNHGSKIERIISPLLRVA